LKVDPEVFQHIPTLPGQSRVTIFLQKAAGALVSVAIQKLINVIRLAIGRRYDISSCTGTIKSLEETCPTTSSGWPNQLDTRFGDVVANNGCLRKLHGRKTRGM
jgi:hypothetical protein